MAKKPEILEVYRDVKSGQFVAERDHNRRPTTNGHERRPVPSPVGEHKRHLRKGKQALRGAAA
jgi:hypothetical protein